MALSRLAPNARIARPGDREHRPEHPCVARRDSRPSGIGRRRVRCIKASGWRSMIWLNADAPPATRAVPTIM